MAREHIVYGVAGPVYVNETDTREHILAVVYLNETVVIAPPTPTPDAGPPPPSGGIPAYAHARPRTEEDVRRSRRLFGLPVEEAEAVSAVAEAQLANLQLDDLQRQEHLQREFALRGLQAETRHLQALNEARQALIDQEIALRLRRMLADEQSIILIMAASIN